jgi:drug/metabolite transporter (DMT)-like permease
LVPVAVILLSTFVLKEKPTLKQILFSVLSLSAVIVISLLSNDGGNNSLIGIVLLLGAVVCAAVFNILSRSESERFTPFERTYMMFLIGTIGFNIIALVTLRENFFSELTVAVSSLEFWGAVGYLSVLSSIAAFMLYNYSTSVISSVRAASFSNIITVISVFAGLIILKENLSVPQIICSFLIIIGVFGVNKK